MSPPLCAFSVPIIAPRAGALSWKSSRRYRATTNVSERLANNLSHLHSRRSLLVSCVAQPASSTSQQPLPPIALVSEAEGPAPPSPASVSNVSSVAFDGASLDGFKELIASVPGARLAPVWRAVFSDQLTPVVAYRCLVHENETSVPSFLLESVETGSRVGRYSYVGARPALEVKATAHSVSVIDNHCAMDWILDGIDTNTVQMPTVTVDTATGCHTTRFHCPDPWDLVKSVTKQLKVALPSTMPGGTASFGGGWVGYGSYDTVRYMEPDSLPFSSAPPDDLGLPDIHLGLYRDFITFDHVAKVVYIVHWIDLSEFPDAMSLDASSNVFSAAVEEAFERGMKHMDEFVDIISRGVPLSNLLPGKISINVGIGSRSDVENSSNMTREQFGQSLDRIHQHIIDGDTFQTVFSQRFERWSEADPFSTYRALRVINPSPYMIYMQCAGCTLVASSPEILCRVVDGVVTNRPLAGTRHRGRTEEEDVALERELLADEKDVAEHRMLVDLGRNDVGRVAKLGTVKPDELLVVERYSNVMHISSTVTGILEDGLSSWDALRAALPVGTISGAPKIRAMQIIDDLEPTRRGPYGGGIGFISFADTLNMALALRTMVVPDSTRCGRRGNREWRYLIQAGAGIVLESNNEAEYAETVNKAMALNRAVDLAETAFPQSTIG